MHPRATLRFPSNHRKIRGDVATGFNRGHEIDNRMVEFMLIPDDVPRRPPVGDVIVFAALGDQDGAETLCVRRDRRAGTTAAHSCVPD